MFSKVSQFLTRDRKTIMISFMVGNLVINMIVLIPQVKAVAGSLMQFLMFTSLWG